MCDCFHVVLPTWPGAPGSVSGHQLQPEEPDLETEEDASVTEGPAGEVIRPRPQGSSPIYECSTEGAGPGVQDDIASRQGSLGRRRSWWKRDSGDSRTFSSMSRPEPVQEATEVTLKTEVEAGASGYSVTGGGDQGIFVKQVLKDSSAAKLFSLREGDQLLSATIFFDDIKYEDALKILQYSEPYKVQFQIKRKLPASEDKGGALRSSQHESVASGKQEKDVADGCAETPKKTLEEDGDQERLIAKPRETRGRKARERLSWPKFQGMKGKQGPGPRRSHSSSEAQERGSARELSPTSTDTEVQCSGDHGEQSAGRDGQKRRRRFPSLRFRKGSRQDPPIMGRQDREVLGEPDSTRKLEDTWAGGTEAQKARQVLTTVQDAEPSSLGHWEGATVRQQRKTKQVKPTAGETAGEEARAGPALDDEREEPQGLTKKITAVSLRGTESTLRRTEEIHVRIRDLKTPTFTFPREKVPGTEDKTWRRAEERRETAWVGRAGTQAEGQAEADQQDKEPGTSGGMGRSQERELGETELRGTQPGQGEDRDKERGELKTKLPRFKMLAFGWSPAKEATRHMRNDIREKEEISGTLETTEVGGRGHKSEGKDPKGELGGLQLEEALPSMNVDVQGAGSKLEGEVATKDGKFKMPKFKMPSFGMSGPGKSIEASLEVSTPKVDAEVALSTIQADLKSPEAGTQQPSTDMEMSAGQVAVKVPEVELPAASTGASLKSHLPKVQMPCIKMPKVELKGPQVDVKGPKAEAKGPKGELSGPELEVALPIVDVDVQAPGHKLEGEVSTKDSKLKMPKFKMPSFGVSASGKAIEASLEASTRKLEAEVALPAIQGDLKSPEPGAQQPPSGVDFPAVQAAAKLPEGELPSVSTGASLKGHLPKVQMPSLKMPKVELKGPQVEVKDPKAEVKVPKGELSGPELEAAVPSGEVDIQATGGKLEGEVATKDGKFKMPKFKMPSFGVSAPGKSIEASLEVSASKLEAEVALPAIQGDLKRPEAHAQLPTTDVELPAGQLAVKVPEGDLAEEEMPAALGGASLKGHLPKVQMPSLKMPSVELKGPHVDVKGPKVDVKVPKTEVKGPTGEPSGPELEAALPSMEVDVQAPSGHLEVEVAAKDSKFKMPKFKMPSFGMSGPGKSIEASLEVSTPKVEAEVALPTIQADLKSPEAGTQQPSTDVEMSAGQVAVKVPEVEVPAASTGASLKGHLPKVQMPSIKMPKVELKGPQVDVKGPKAEAKGPKGELSGPELEVALPIVDVDVQAPGHKLEGEVSTKDSKLKMPKFKMPSFGMSGPGKSIEASLELSTPKLEAEVALSTIQGDLKSPETGAQLPSADVDLHSGQSAVKLPEAALPVSELLPSDGGTENAVFSGGVTGSSVVLPLMSETLTQFHGPALSPPQHGAPQHGASESLSVAPYVGLWSSGFPQSEEPPPAHPSGHPTPPLSPPTVTFPKFHKPRFMVSVPLTVVPEGDSGIAVQGAVLPHGQAPGQDALAPEVHVSHLTGFPVAPGAAPMSEIIEQPLSLSVGAAVAEGPEGEWAGSPSKRNRFKLPLFSRSPKKEAKSAGDSLCHLEDPSGSLTVDLDHEDSQPGVQGSHMEAHIALPPGKEGDSERTRKVGFSLPRLALPKLKVSKGRAGPRPQGDIDTVLSSSTAAGDCEATGRGGRKDGMGSTSLPERPHEAGHVAPQLPQTPMPSVGFAKPAFQSAPAKEGARWCEPDPRQDPGVGEDSKGSGLGDILGRQPPREGTAPTPKDTLKPSPGYADRGPALDSPEEAPTTVVPAADSKEHWSRMPRLHVPGFGGSLSKQCSGAREQNVAQVHMLAATAPAEMAAASSVLESSAPRSEVEASVSLQPSNTKAVVTGSGSASHPDVLRLDLHAPTVGKPGVDQPHSEVQIRPAEGSLPLQKPSSWPPEPQTPAAERCDLTKEDERVELRPSLPEGPVMLRVSSTDVPSQVSVVDMRQLWEDSVLTVTFPKLRAPRFSFPAPGSEADVFFPVVRDVRGAGPGVDPGPGLWDASLLSAGPDCLSKASPVSKVKVHIQAEQGASHQVVVCSQVTREHAERVVPEAFSSQIVRESEIPTSTVQTPSYGFSLLKVKTLGPPAQAPDPRGQESSAATRADSLSEDGAPEAAEPFEVISASASLPGPRTLGSDIPARPPPADSGSEDDEEPAEILEFLPEDSGEAAAPPAAENRVLKGRPEGKKPSGVFWSWLPSIGFSSSVSETTADSREDAQRSVPVQTQPAPRPDLELPKKQERVGWFRLPKLGFSSSPAKNAKSIEDEAGLAERTLQEESVTFFDAQESFSPEEKEGEPAGSTPGAIGMVASLARTELILLEPQAPTSEESVPGPTSK